ncbi:exonuclease [Reticulomyxa filosa]|uniref:Exonuclease n=1 Tax=Reticulomyxa filosa TaxID=46433 RepID=X6P4U4_RETFI|nr:exonuclease [Reticulomyxa filosa]|eukprot:ETO33221.1 exonuclease [Reticulomyxa filosa]
MQEQAQNPRTWEQSDLKNHAKEIREKKEQSKQVLKLIDDYKQAVTLLHNNLYAVSKESSVYINKFVLEGTLKNYHDLVEQYPKWGNIKFYIDDINSKINFKETKDEELVKYISMSEEELYKLPVLEKILKENERLKNLKEGSSVKFLYETTVTGLNELRNLVQNTIFFELREKGFNTYDSFIKNYNELKELKSNIDNLHKSYKDLFNIGGTSTPIKDKQSHDSQETYYNGIRDKFTTLFGFKAKYFATEEEKSLKEKEASWAGWAKNKMFGAKTKEMTQDDKKKASDFFNELKDINDPAVIQKIHEKFQAFAAALVDTGKAECFQQAIQKQKEATNCMIERPSANIELKYENKCEALDHTANVLTDNCLNIFPMETIHDDLIKEALRNVSVIEVEVANDETTSLIFYSQARYQKLDVDATESFALENPKDILIKAAADNYNDTNSLPEA